MKELNVGMDFYNELQVDKYLLAKAADIKIIAQPYGGFIYSKSLNTYTVINNTGYLLLKQIRNSNNDITKPANHLSETYNLNYQQVYNDIKFFLQELKDFFYIRNSPFIPDKIEEGFSFEYEETKDILKLVKASIDLTYRCNLKCKYCYAKANEINLEELSLNKWKDILNHAYKKGLRGLEITGGEPFLYKDILDFIDFVSDKFIFEINTNGFFINKEVAKFLASKSPKAIQISLDAPKPEIHDKYRGTGSWKTALKALKFLREEGIYTRISMTVYKENERFIEEMYRLSQELDCELIIQSAKPAGRAEGFPISFFIKDPQDKSETFYEFDPNFEIYCQTQLGYASISSNGVIKPCNMSPDFFIKIGLYDSMTGEELKNWYNYWFEENIVGHTFKKITELSKSFDREKIDKSKMIYPSCILEAYLKFLIKR